MTKPHVIRLATAIVLVQLLSCTKTIDTSKDSVSLATSSDATLVQSYGNCKLRKVYQNFGGDPGSVAITGLFTYNGQGNPVSVLYTDNGTGNRNHHFIYDNQQRLRQYHQRYGDFNVQEHRYGYNAANQIVKDTAYEREAGGNYVTVSTLEYDVQGRVVKETIVNISNNGFPLSPTRRPTYTYDARGNLAVAGWKSSSYDSKVSVFRSHPVFQFIHRNYSMNNGATQAKYNSKGLPLSINPANDVFFNAGVCNRIDYDCL